MYAVLRCGGTLALNVPGVVRYQHEHKFAKSWSDYDADYPTHRGGERVLGRGRIEPVGFRLFSLMAERDAHMREPIVWVKGSGPGTEIAMNNAMGSDNNPYLRACHEFILLGSKGQWFHRGGTGRRGAEAVPFTDERKDVWYIPPVASAFPAVFPVEIPLRLCRLFTHAEDAVVCDPFMGSGTSIIAAERVGRSGVGIELEPRQFDEACRRVENAVQGRT